MTDVLRELGSIKIGAEAGSRPDHRSLPLALPRRDIVYATPETCKTCCGSELPKVGKALTEVLEYVLGRFC